MRVVNFVDERGYLRQSRIKDEDPDSKAKYGIPVEIPNIEALDWDGFKRDLHNALMRENLYTLEDVMKTGQAFYPAMAVLKRYLTEHYLSESNSSGG